MTQQIIDVGATANDGTGEPLRQAFTAVNDNFTQIWTAGPVGTNVKISGNIVTTTVTNLGLTLAGNGIGNIQANSSIVPGTSGVYDLGAPDNKFQYIYGDYLVGNGALITGIVANTSYNNANVAAFLPTYTGNLVSLTGPVITTSNITGGNIATSGVVSAAGNITGNTITGNSLRSLGTISAAGNITTAANVSANYFIGNGALLTGITATNISAAALTGTTLSSNVLYSSLQVVDDLLYLDVVGNITTTGQFVGSGAGLTTIPGANVSGQVANALVARTVYANAQPNITSVGVLTSLSATGNISGNYFIGNGALLTGIAATNVNANALIGDTLSSNVLYSSLKVVDDLLYLDVVGNITTTGQFVGSGAGLTAIPGANITGTVANAAYATVAGTVASSAQPNITSVGTLTSLSSSGNVTANYFIGNGSQLTEVTAARVSANALTGNTLSANVLNSSLVSVGNLNGLSVIGNTTGGNFLAQDQISAAGNITGNYFIGNGSQLTGIVASNIGVLPSLSVTGNTTTGNLLSNGSISAVGNIQTIGNISGNYFIGNGSLLTGITVEAGTAIVNGNSNVNVGANGNVTISTAGVSNVAVFDPTGVSIAGLISATGNIAGNYLLGNGALITGLPAGYSNAEVANYLPTYSGNLVSLAGPVTTTSNVTGGNVLTGGLVSATGNVYGNVILSDNYRYANGVPIPTGIVYTASTSPPAGPDLADQWYDTANDVLYEYISDGTSQYWVDVNSPAFAGGVVANVAISGSMIPNANLVYNIGSPSTVFNTAYINTVNVSAAVNSSLINVGTLANAAGIVLQTNGANAISIDSNQNLTFANRLRANAMPVGAVVQTVMSSSLGGSITNSTSYVDISLATVTITPSSATSKILILATGTSSFTAVSGANVTADTQLVRSPTISLQIQNYSSSIAGGGIGGSGTIAYSYQDSPGTTSPVTYKLQQKISNASSTLTSTNIWLIAMEIAA